MHKFLRAVGFSKITKEELNDIFQKIIERPMLQKVAEDSEVMSLQNSLSSLEISLDCL